MDQETGTPETETQGLTEQQATEELLKRWAPKEEKGAEAEPETEETSEAEQPEGDAEATEETEEEGEPADIEIDFAGTKFKVPPAFSETAQAITAKAREIEKGATRRFEEAADLRKATEAQQKAVAELQKVAHANATLLGDHAMVSRRLAQLEAIDINATDAETLTRLNAEYNQLQAAQRRINEQYQANVVQMRDEEAKSQKAKREHSEKILQTHIKGWGPEKAKALAEYATSRGAPPEALNQITDAWMVEILDDAAYGRQMKDSKQTLNKRVQETPKTLKPSGTKIQPSQKVEALKQKAHKSGSIDDAVMALLARASTRKR
jgi:hypothetical protein